MTTRDKRTSRSLSASDKVHAIERIQNGESKASVSRHIGVPESTIRGWCKNEYKLRVMSYQSAESENMNSKSLSDKFYGNSTMFKGPSGKRQRLNYSTPLNFSNNHKKALADYSANNEFNPARSLSQSSLAINSNELTTTNLKLLAQFNPDLAALCGHSNTTRNNGNNVEQKSDSYIENWIQQKHSTPTSSYSSTFAFGFSQTEFKNQLKTSKDPLMQTQLDENVSILPVLNEDTLYKSIVAYLNMNNNYPTLQPPVCSSTPITALPPFTLSTPSRSLNDKNASWFNFPIPLGSNGDLTGSKEQDNNKRISVGDCKDILDHLVHNINNDNGKCNGNDHQYASYLTFNEYQGKYNSSNQFSLNNDHNSQKMDENIPIMKCTEPCDKEVKVEEADADFRAAIKHGEIFLQWLENINNPLVTTNQLKQLRFLLSSLKTNVDSKTDVDSKTYVVPKVDVDSESTSPRFNLSSADIEDPFKSM